MAESRTLSAKERLFAEKLADGLGPTDAYRSVYSNSAASRTAQANGRQVAKRPRVIAEVERLRRNPPPNNFRAIKEFAVEKLFKMAESDPKSRRATSGDGQSVEIRPGRHAAPTVSPTNTGRAQHEGRQRSGYSGVAALICASSWNTFASADTERRRPDAEA